MGRNCKGVDGISRGIGDKEKQVADIFKHTLATLNERFIDKENIRQKISRSKGLRTSISLIVFKVKTVKFFDVI